MNPKNRISISPGELIQKEYIDQLQISKKEFAYQYNIDIILLNDILNGKEIDSQIANILAKALNTSAQFWLNLQKTYNLSKEN